MKNFHFSFGQAMALAFMGLQAYAATQAPGASAETVFTNPANLNALAQGVASVFAAQPTQ